MATKNIKKKRTVKRILCGSVIAFWLIVPCVIFLGGIDIDPVDDKDLLLPENSMPYDPDGNGWAMLSNVLSRVETIENELISNSTNYLPQSEAYLAAKGLLCWYADPTKQEWVLGRVGEDRDDGMEFLSNFTNRATACSYVESLLKSNEWVLAGIDSAIAANRYSPPPVSKMTGDQFCLPRSEIRTVNRSFLLARVRHEFERGNYDAGVDAFRKALGLATLLQSKCGKIDDYFDGMTMIEDDVSCMDQILADISLPKATLSALNDSLGTLTGFSSGAMCHALKREYAFAREHSQLAPADILYPRKSQLYKIVHSPLARYICHPNRRLRDAAILVRKLIESNFEIQDRRDGKRDMRKWYDFCFPNRGGPSCVAWINVVFDFVLYFMQDAERDVTSLKSKISRIVASNERRNFASSYFPLVMTNGCYYTYDLKHIVAVAKSSESIVVGADVEIGEAADFGHADVEIGEAADFSHVKKVIVLPGCEGWLETWSDALREPTNLVDVCVGDDNTEIGKTSNLIYERESGRIINIYGNEKSLTIPANLVVPYRDSFVEQLRWHGIERLHFCGSLPDFCRRITRDSHGQRIARWWKSGGWEYFKRIFVKKKVRPFLDRAPHGLVVTVSRQHADERTRQIVESGMWEGRPIRWSEPNE